jgi:hypothetical protein
MDKKGTTIVALDGFSIDAEYEVDVLSADKESNRVFRHF